MPASSELVERSGDLKAALVEFGKGRRFARHWTRRSTSIRGRAGGDDAEVANAVDRFILEYRLPDGKTVVEVFVEEHLDLTDEERTLLLGWRDVVEGIFQVDRREGQNAGHDEPRRRADVPSTLEHGAGGDPEDAEGDRSWQPGWCRSEMNGSSAASRTRIPHPCGNEIYRAAVERDAHEPGVRLSEPGEAGAGLGAPAGRATAASSSSSAPISSWRPGTRSRSACAPYMHFRTHEVRDKDGKSATDRRREAYGEEPPEIDFGLPDQHDGRGDRCRASTTKPRGCCSCGISACWRKRSAIHSCGRPPTQGGGARLLRDSSISPVAFRRLASGARSGQAACLRAS